MGTKENIVEDRTKIGIYMQMYYRIHFHLVE